MNVPSYGSPLALGHRLLEGLFSGPVLVQEKVDGSQFSFMVDPETGDIKCRSRKQVIGDQEVPNLFSRAYQYVHDIHAYLTPGWVYRAEAISSPKHNTLTYERTPKGYLILFDIDFGPPDVYKNPADYALFLRQQAERSELECVPTLFAGQFSDDVQRTLAILESYLDRKSVLGGQTVEGVVVKNLMVLGVDKKPLMGKLVRSDFKELNDKTWKEANPGKNDFIDKLGEHYRTEARWRKAVQHLDELNVLEWEPRDIPKLIKEVQADVLKEHEEDLKEVLFAHFWQRNLSRMITRGLPEFYKEVLRERMGN